MARLGTKVMLAVLTGVAVAVMAEGLVSLASNRSLARRLRDGPARATLPRTAPRATPPGDDDRRKAALTNPGLYRVHRDPLVGYVLKSDADQKILDGQVRSDDLGLRARPGPPAPPGAVRLVVLGDSVAFGYGLNDDQTLAHQLEAQLNAVRGAGLPPVAGRTVAIPGWNYRNAIHCLLDHFDELDPDIVVYLPVGNDLTDSDGVWESGHRRSAPDIASRDPWLQVGVRTDWPFLQPLIDEAAAGGRPAEIAARLGPVLLNSNLPTESRARYQGDADAIALLARTLAARGRKLLLVPYVDGAYVVHLLRHLADSSNEQPTLRLFRDFPKEFQLADDPHPNAQAVTAMATWIADELLRLGWVERGVGEPLPAVGAQYEALRSRPMSPAEIATDSDELSAELAAQLRPAVDFTTLEGINQVYGTLNDDASAAMRMLLALAPGGTSVLVRLAPLADRPDLYPLEVGVEIDGRAVGSVVVTADGPAQAQLAGAAPRRGRRAARSAPDARALGARAAGQQHDAGLLPAAAHRLRVAMSDPARAAPSALWLRGLLVLGVAGAHAAVRRGRHVAAGGPLAAASRHARRDGRAPAFPTDLDRHLAALRRSQRLPRDPDPFVSYVLRSTRRSRSPALPCTATAWACACAPARRPPRMRCASSCSATRCLRLRDQRRRDARLPASRRP